MSEDDTVDRFARYPYIEDTDDEETKELKLGQQLLMDAQKKER